MKNRNTIKEIRRQERQWPGKMKTLEYLGKNPQRKLELLGKK